MLLQVGLIFASCIAISSCSNNFQSEINPDVLNIESSNNIQQISVINKKLGMKPESPGMASEFDSNFAENSDRKNGAVSGNNYSSQPLSFGNYMTLTNTGEQNNFGNPIFELQLNVDGQKLSSHRTVAGRYYIQNRDRDVSGTEAPLPNGIYSDYVCEDPQ